MAHFILAETLRKLPVHLLELQNGKALLVTTLVLMLLGSSVTAIGQVTVPGTASGRFSDIDGSAGPLVPGFVFGGPTTVMIDATGSVDLSSGFLAITPDGTSCPAGSSGCTCNFPLEEAVAEAAGDPLPPAAPPHFDVGALMGAFIAQTVVNTPGFVPFDEDRTGADPGIPSTELFLIGAGPFQFSVPGPGTLFLGLNDCLASNNVGEYSVTIQDQVTVNIDIKPGSFPNSINLSSAGVIPVAILSSGTFDATTIDPDTVSLAGAGVRLVGKSSKPLAHAEDVNWDGLLDLVCQVVTEQILLETGDSIAVLEAMTFDGVSVRGEDSVSIVPD